MINVAIFCGGPSSEHEVSLRSAQSILTHINRKKYNPFVFFIRHDLTSTFFAAQKILTIPHDALWKDFEHILEESRNMFDIALLASLHGEFGEDGTIQQHLERLKIPFTGSDSKASALCFNKYSAMQIIKDIRAIQIPETLYLALDELTATPPRDFPFVLKPNTLGSSVLVRIIKSQKDYETVLTEYKKHTIPHILIQEYIEGIELSCGCLQRKDRSFIKLPPIEIQPKSEFFDYDAKYKTGGSKEITPPVSISKDVSASVSELATRIHKKLHCSTYSRSDFIYKDETLYYLETNTLPGMTATSLLPQEAQAAHISFTELIDTIITTHL